MEEEEVGRGEAGEEVGGEEMPISESNLYSYNKIHYREVNLYKSNVMIQIIPQMRIRFFDQSILLNQSK